MFNNNCFIKFYNINNKLIRVGLCRENKFIFKNNDEYLSTEYKKYVGKFNEFNWLNANLEYSVNLDELFMSIELENGTEILYSNINVGNTYTNIDEENPLSRIEKILYNCEPKLLVSDHQPSELIKSASKDLN
ncbi:MAG: hypothetical protein HOA47_03340, partial [Verrucomicrobia bacterium]|nr:hypothetical protein [Verrucomicrobiota bacterium]